MMPSARLSPALLTTLLLLAACSGTPTPPSSGGSASQAASSAALVSRRPCAPADFLPGDAEWAAFWKTEPATTSVTLDRPDLGFKAEIPYNPAWGNADCQLPPYEEYDEQYGRGVRFGFASVFEGGGAARFNGLSFLPARTAEKAVAAITKEQEPDRKQGILPPGTEPTITNARGLTFVQYYYGGFCDQTNVEVIGARRNYLLASTCNIDPNGIAAVLGSLSLYE